jgi:O-antigen ligase
MPRRHKYSLRAWLLAGFIALAMILGGGGTGNPGTEVILQLLFAAFAFAWIWGKSSDGPQGGIDRTVLLLLPIPLILPIIQLIPLPPSVWTMLPGRADAVAALQLVGEHHAWRPISLSPARTLASLLATIPPICCLYAAATLPVAERRLVLAAIGCLAVVAALFGAIQLVSPGGGLNFYRNFSLTWVTGFQANRNAGADVFLIGLLALGALGASQWARSLETGAAARRLPASLVLVSGAALLLLAATVMTGSRAGIVLALPALLAIGAMFLAHSSFAAGKRAWMMAGAAAALGLATLVALWLAAPNLSAVGRVLVRFTGLEDERWHVWEDTRYAIAQYWPVGSGMGTFGPVAFAVERLEVVDQTYPNRAHNEYLEIGLEAGIAGYIAVAAAALVTAVLAARAWRDRRERGEQAIFAVAVLAILALHSLVDYPMRSMALACLAGVAAGILAKSPYHRDPPPPADVV